MNTKNVFRKVGTGLLAAGLAFVMAWPALTVSAASMEMRVVGGGSSASVDRKTDVSFAIVLHGSPSGATKGQVSATGGANLTFKAGASTPGGSTSGNTVTWNAIDFQPNADQIVTATFHVNDDAPCGSTTTSSSSAAGYGSASVTLTVTCGLGGGAGRVPSVVAPAALQPSTGSTNITQPSASQPNTQAWDQGSAELTPQSDLGDNWDRAEAMGGAQGSATLAEGEMAPAALPNAGGEALPLGGLGSAGSVLAAMGWYLKRRTS